MRTRITITISTDVLNQVDRTIDNFAIRNRSQAIEALVTKSLSPQVETAVILAGGALVTDPVSNKQTCKSLIQIKAKPVIYHLLKLLEKHKFSKVVLCTSPDSHADIVSVVDKYKNELSFRVVYSQEKELLGTGGAIKQATKLIGSSDFVMLHGDILTDINLTELIQFYHQNPTLAVIAVKPRPGRLAYGRVFIEGSSVVDFQVPDKSSPISLVNSGVYVFSNQILNFMPDDSKFKLEELVIPQLIKKRLIKASVFQGIWFDVSDPESYAEANQRWPG